MYEQLKLENQLCFPLYASARKIVGLYTSFLKDLGLTYTQYVAMMVLWEKDSCKVGELCESLFLDNGTVTPLLKKLESEGLVSRIRSREDERVVTVSLTEKGKSLKEKAKDIPFKVGSCINLDEEEAESLHRFLYKILDDKQR